MPHYFNRLLCAKVMIAVRAERVTQYVFFKLYYQTRQVLCLFLPFFEKY